MDNSLQKKKTLIVIVGPTAIGKTATAIEIAKRYKTSIISADSRQFFREMNIGTAKPSEIELAAAPHYFINSHSVEKLFSTGDFEIEALTVINQLFEKKQHIGNGWRIWTIYRRRLQRA